MAERSKLSQREVDIVRNEIMIGLLLKSVRDRIATPGVHHVRFLKRPETSAWLVRQGNPPADADRMPWERGLCLELDLGTIEPDLALAVLALMEYRDQNPERRKEITSGPMASYLARLLKKQGFHGEIADRDKGEKLETRASLLLKEQVEQNDLMRSIRDSALQKTIN